VHDRRSRQIKKLVDFQISIAMGTAHEFLPDQADADGWFTHAGGSLAEEANRAKKSEFRNPNP
jgi:hypothetical protein